MPYECRVRTLESQPMLSIRGRTSFARLAETIGEYLAEVWGFVAKNGGTPAGPPFTRYHSTDNLDALDLEAGLPLVAPIPGAGRIVAGALPGGEVAATDHMGRYEDLPNAGDALTRWCAENGRMPAGPNWEVYWTDPESEKDQSKWRTEVLKPLVPQV